MFLCVVNRSFTWYQGIIRKNMAVVQSLFFGAIAAAMFGISLVSGGVGVNPFPTESIGQCYFPWPRYVLVAPMRERPP